MQTLRLAPVVVAALAAVACGSNGATGSGDPDPPATATQAAATPAGLGTLHASVDGVDKTWYVVSGTVQGRPYASGAWMELEPGRRVVVIGGFDTPTPPLDTSKR